MSQNLDQNQIKSISDEIIRIVGCVTGEKELPAVENAVREVMANAITKAQEIIKTKLSGLNLTEVVAIVGHIEGRKRDMLEKMYKEQQAQIVAATEASQVVEAKEESVEEVKETDSGRRGKGKRK